jgi:hypothetical protein
VIGQSLCRSPARLGERRANDISAQSDRN